MPLPTLSQFIGQSAPANGSAAKSSLPSVADFVKSAPSATAAPKPSPAKGNGAISSFLGGAKSVADKIGSMGEGFDKAVASSEIGAGQDIAAAIGGNKYADQLKKMATDDTDYISMVVGKRNQAAQSGQDTSHWDTLLKSYKTTTGESLTDVFPAIGKSNEQVAGDLAGVGLDAVTAGAGSEAVKGATTAAKTGADAAKGSSLFSRLFKGSKTGAKYGAAYGAAQGLQQGKGAAGVAESTAAGAAGGAALGGAGAGIFGKAKTSDNIDKLIEETSGIADKKTRISSLEKTGMTDKSGKPIGGSKSTILGGIKTLPDKSAIDRAKSVQGIVKPGASPVSNLQNINKEISRISEQEIEPALTKAGAISPISDKAPGWSTVVQKMRDIEKPDLIKADSTLNKTYDLVRNRMIEQIRKQQPTVKGLWDARKSFDKVVQDQFGDAAFDSEKNTAIKRAISDMRRSVNEIIGEKVPQYKDAMQNLSNMYDARYNIAEKYQNLLDKGGKEAFKALNPKTYKTLLWGTGAAGTYAADKTVKKLTGFGV